MRARVRHPSEGGYERRWVGVKIGTETTPVLCVELNHRTSAQERENIRKDLSGIAASKPHTRGIKHFLFHRGFPVDIRHNAKIVRENLAEWADTQMRQAERGSGG